MSKILVIPDTQVKRGVPLDHLRWCGQYLVAKQPDVVVHIGDFADLPSLSSYDIGTKAFEGRRYKDDIAAAHTGMTELLSPLWEYNKKQSKTGKKQYKPRQVITLGNHCERINKAVNADAKLEGVLSMADLGYEDFGWEVHPFLKPVIIEGIAFCHYFPSGVLGRPTTTARALLNKMHMSCFAGHMQGRDIAFAKRADGRELTAIISGSFYMHDEDYLSPMTNQHFRGVWMLHQVRNGSFDECAVSIDYLGMKYGGKKEGWFHG